MQNFEAAWFDIDGTLSPDEVVIPDEVREALRQIPRWGVNTARGYQSTTKIMAGSEMSLPTIASLGTEIWNPQGELQTTFPISELGLQQISKILTNYQIKKVWSTIVGKPQRIIYASTAKEILKGQQKYPVEKGNYITAELRQLVDHIVTQHVGIMIVRLEDPAANSQVLNQSQGDFSVAVNSQGHLQFTAQGVDKGSSLLWICRDLGLDPATVLTAGNDIADEPMFAQTYGVKVGDVELQNVQKTVENPHALATFLLQVLAASA